eukprot:CAMPEP_0204441634 /NCGR_PEP_ID=MMETSP0470-20130426/85624_1 /ASSEMBLY_ACC=CAM_ASM_000385 /TAXON_ID=2969 /ORGANISM="Oxyrrhis marina" /LENGTH=337 /DNA_ID=CAMNT_0051440785 /DNA_START=247 /DNA_END=1261 /DNA_ORIENTATION=+
MFADLFKETTTVWRKHCFHTHAQKRVLATITPLATRHQWPGGQDPLRFAVHGSRVHKSTRTAQSELDLTSNQIPITGHGQSRPHDPKRAVASSPGQLSRLRADPSSSQRGLAPGHRQPLAPRHLPAARHLQTQLMIHHRQEPLHCLDVELPQVFKEDSNASVFWARSFLNTYSKDLAISAWAAASRDCFCPRRCWRMVRTAPHKMQVITTIPDAKHSITNIVYPPVSSSCCPNTLDPAASRITIAKIAVSETFSNRVFQGMFKVWSTRKNPAMTVSMTTCMAPRPTPMMGTEAMAKERMKRTCPQYHRSVLKRKKRNRKNKVNRGVRADALGAIRLA